MKINYTTPALKDGMTTAKHYIIKGGTIFMFKFKKKNALIASVLAGSILFMPLAGTNVAYADTRTNIYNYGDRMFSIEEDTISDFTVSGIHYVSLWMVQLQQGGISSFIPVIGAFTKERENLGYKHVIIKFEEDGSYHADNLNFNNKEKGKQREQDMPKMEQWWINALKKAYSPQNDDRYAEYAGKDYLDPRNWHDTSYTHKEDDRYVLSQNAIRYIVAHLKETRPEVIQENIALNKRDQAKALAQHEAMFQKEKDDKLAKLVQDADTNHVTMKNAYTNTMGKDAKSVLNGMGNYNWDMFLNEGAARPNIDANTLINNVWYLDYVGSNDRSNPFHAIVRFKPVFLVMQDTGEILWDYSLIEMSVLWEADAKYNNRHIYDHEVFYLEQSRADGRIFYPNISITPSKTPDNGGEKKIIMASHKPNEGDFRTTGASPYSYIFRAGYTGNDFWLMERDGNFNDKPTDWGYHLTKVQ